MAMDLSKNCGKNEGQLYLDEALLNRRYRLKLRSKSYCIVSSIDDLTGIPRCSKIVPDRAHDAQPPPSIDHRFSYLHHDTPHPHPHP